MSQPPEVSRRDFLKVSSLAGIGLVIEVYLAACGQRSAPTPVPVQPTGLPSESPVSTQSSVATIAQASSPTPPAATIPQAGSPTPAPLAASEVLAPSLYLKIGKNGLVTITIPRSEMGQGVRTALAMIVAEELCADWSTIRLEQAPGDRSYGDQTTGGSTSIQTFYDILRRARSPAAGASSC
jgi:hypothetical protein